MKPITINVGEPIYRKFQKQAKAQQRTASELIREAMEEYARHYIDNRPSLHDLRPVSLGKCKDTALDMNNLSEEMLDAGKGD